MSSQVLDYRGERRSWAKDLGYPKLLDDWDVDLRNGSAGYHEDVVETATAQFLHDARKDRHVSSGQNAQADHLHVLLQGSAGDHLRRLEETCVHHLESGVAQRSHQHLGA